MEATGQSVAPGDPAFAKRGKDLCCQKGFTLEHGYEGEVTSACPIMPWSRHRLGYRAVETDMQDTEFV